jgi:hypothetical protein
VTVAIEALLLATEIPEHFRTNKSQMAEWARGASEVLMAGLPALSLRLR